MNATDRFRSPTRRLAWGLGLAALFASAPAARTQTPAAPVPVVQPGQPGKLVVEDVVPQGNHQVSAQRIMGLIKTRPGVEYQQETVNEDVRQLYNTRLFANVKVQTQPTGPGKIKVYFLVAEFPSVIQDIVYQGAKHIKPDELETLTGLRKGMPLNPIANQVAKQAILRRYYEKGRMFAGVELLEGDKPGDTRVVFQITEGPVVKVKSIKFEGITFVGAGRLMTQVDSSRTFLGLGGDYDAAKALHDVTRLEEYYKSFGYHDVRVTLEPQYDTDERYVHLVFHVSEGERYRVVHTQVDGNKTMSADQLLKRSKVEQGQYYDKRKTETDVQIMQAMYGYEGRDAKVHEQNFYPAPGQVDVHYEVQESQPAKVGSIYVVGNTVTKQNVILRQVPLYPGQTLTYPDLRLAERNLAKLQIFEVAPEKGIRPTVSIIDRNDTNEWKDILVSVNEMPTGSLMFGVGVNSDAGLTGSIALNERNFDITNWPTSLDELLSGQAFRGAGQEFRAEAVPGTQLQRYMVSWREPYFLDSQYSLGVSGYYFNRAYNEYTESRLGTRVTVGRRLNQLWSTSGTLRLEEVGVHDVPSWEPEDFQEARGDHFLASTRFALTRDSRDSFLRPTSGSMVEGSFEQFFGDYTFPQLNLEANKYWTTYERPDGSGKHVIALRSQIGWTGDNTPVFERFYAGGFRSMRGFEFRGVGPDVNGFKVGGDFQFLNSAEYQIPILANDQLYSVFFVDSGTVERNVAIRDYRVSAGFGLRVVVPMLGPVPIALDFGFPIVKGPQDREQVFSFWVGFFH